MGKLHETITSELAEWIARQRVYFFATAPLAPDGHINLSPKGGDTFRVVGPLEAVHQDLTGSGAETAAHLRENGRLVVMFCAFEGPPKIVRLHGRGTLVEPGDPDYPGLEALFPRRAGTRAFVRLAVTRVSDSCGQAVPFLDYRGPRETLDKWAEAQGAERLAAYRAAKNRRSVDGLPAFDPPV